MSSSEPTYRWWYPLRRGPVLRRVLLVAALVALGVVCLVLGGVTILSLGVSLLLIAVIEAVVVGIGLRSALAAATGTGRVRRGSARSAAILVAVGAVAVATGSILRGGAYFDPRVMVGEILLIVGLYPLAAGLVMIVSRRQRQPAEPAEPGDCHPAP